MRIDVTTLSVSSGGIVMATSFWMKMNLVKTLDDILLPVPATDSCRRVVFELFYQPLF